MAAGKQVGNAVPVALAQLLIERLKPVLEACIEPADIPAPLRKKAA
jgi:hypothetical protein